MHLPKWVGVLNITPDSFSDGGKYTDKETAIAHAEHLVASGVSVIDVGAESTRPDATPLSPEEEWQRVGEMITALCHAYPRDGDITISIDTRHAATAEKAIAAGVGWINDVSGLDDEKMRQIVASAPASVKVVVMHHLGVPANKQRILPEDQNVTDIVLDWAREKLAQLTLVGIDKARIIIDPGIGFGKNAQQSLQLLQNIEAFHALGVELFVGHSRKSFLAPFADETLASKDQATLITSLALAQKKVDYLRVHNAKMHQAAFALFNALHEKDET